MKARPQSISAHSVVPSRLTQLQPERLDLVSAEIKCQHVAFEADPAYGVLHQVRLGDRSEPGLKTDPHRFRRLAGGFVDPENPHRFGRDPE